MNTTPSNVAADRHYVTPEDADRFVRQILEAHGLPDGDAKTVARCLVRADLRGVDSHGLGLLPLYLRRLRAGLLNPTPDVTFEETSPVIARADGDNGFGFVVATRSMEKAIASADQFGIGVVGAWNSTHFGMAANYVLQAVDAGFISLVFTNASRAMPPHGGREAIFGTSPLAAGAPGGPVPFVLDMSPAVAARGRIRRAGRRGEQIPPGYGLDREGRSTTDPAAVLDGGVVLPIGGPKGAAISILMDIMSGVITGAGFAGGVRSQFDDFTAPQNVGHFFMALKPDIWLPMTDYQDRMRVLAEVVSNCAPADGHTEALLPGQPESATEIVRGRSGLPYSSSEIEVLIQEAEQAGIEPLASSRNPLGSDSTPAVS